MEQFLQSGGLLVIAALTCWLISIAGELRASRKRKE